MPPSDAAEGGPDLPAGARRLEDVYDDSTLRAIDGWRPAPRGPAAEPGSRVGPRGVFAGAVLAAALAGTRVALEDEEEERGALLEIRPDPGRRPDLAVEVLFVPGDPRATVALVRPWLLPPGWAHPRPAA